MKWLKTMSKDELREAYEKVTNEEDLQEFENHCQEIGIRIHNAIKKGNKDIHPGTLARWVVRDENVHQAVKALVNHSLKMMDK